MNMPLSLEDRSMLAGLTERSDLLIERAVGWCGIASGSSDLGGLAAMADVLAGELSDLPGTVERIPLSPVEQIGPDGAQTSIPQGESLRLTVRPNAPCQVALTGHYDTVFGPESKFRSVRSLPDGTLNGPGIADMKGGISVMLGALAALEDHAVHPTIGYTVLLSPDEETGSLASAPLLADLARRARIGLTYEPALADGSLVCSRKGSGNYHIVVRGRAAHAGRDFASGRNAIAAAARMAVRLDALNGQRDGLTLNIARIDGGAALNVVPDRAVLRFNLRLPDTESLAWVEGEIGMAMEAERTAELLLELHGGINRPPKPFTASQQRLFERMRETGALLGQSLRWAPSGGVCEGNNLFAHGLPNIDTLGVRGGAIHSSDEFAIPQSFVERAKLSALFLSRAFSTAAS